MWQNGRVVASVISGSMVQIQPQQFLLTNNRIEKTNIVNKVSNDREFFTKKIKVCCFAGAFYEVRSLTRSFRYEVIFAGLKTAPV